MAAVAVACLPIFFTGHAIARWEGGLFLGYFVAYTAYLIALETDAAVTFRIAMAAFVLPLTIITLAIGVVRAVRTSPSEDK